jgi:predicted methyltransferase
MRSNKGVETSTMHKASRDRSLRFSVKSEVEAAGFRLEGESDLLHSAGDPRTANVKDPTIRAQDGSIHPQIQKA